MYDENIFLQVMVLTTAKQMLTHRIDEESSLRCRAEADLKDMTTKCRGAKKTIEVCTCGDKALSAQKIIPTKHFLV